MKSEVRPEESFDFRRSPAPKPVPRMEHDVLVINKGSNLPPRCVKTGALNNLVRRTESVSVGGPSMLVLGGPLAFLFGTKRATLAYSISKNALLQIKRARLLSSLLVIVGLAGIIGAFYLPSLIIFCLGVMLFVAAPIVWHRFGRPIDVCNIWESEIFLRKLPPLLVDDLLAPKTKDL